MEASTSEYRSDVLNYKTLGKRQMGEISFNIPQSVITGIIVGAVVFFVIFIACLGTWIWFHYRPSKRRGHKSDIESVYGSARFSGETLLPRLSQQESLPEKKLEDGFVPHDRQIPSRTTSDDTIISGMVPASPQSGPERPRPTAFRETLRKVVKKPNRLTRKRSEDQRASMDSSMLGEAVAVHMSPASPQMRNMFR